MYAGHVVSAQTVYGSLVGNVRDSAAVRIPGATVTATQTETNLTREVVTNESGAYSIPNIPSGTYQVVVALPGFRISRRATSSSPTATCASTRNWAWARSRKR